MSMRAMTVGLLMLVASPGALASGGEREFTADFPIEECRFSSVGGNPYFILRPGRQLIYDNEACVAEGDCEEFVRLQINVLNETRNVVLADDGVRRAISTRVVEEQEWEDGRLIEQSRNFFAACGTGRG